MDYMYIYTILGYGFLTHSALHCGSVFLTDMCYIIF